MAGARSKEDGQCESAYVLQRMHFLSTVSRFAHDSRTLVAVLFGLASTANAGVAQVPQPLTIVAASVNETWRRCFTPRPARTTRRTRPRSCLCVKTRPTLAAVIFASGRDFAGKTIGVPTLKDLDALATASWVDAHGGDSTTLRYVELPNPALLPPHGPDR